MEVFLQWAESRGCRREEMITFYDAEGNVPLHSAVHSGDFKVNLALHKGLYKYVLLYKTKLFSLNLSINK